MRNPCFSEDQLQEAPGSAAQASPGPHLRPALLLLCLFSASGKIGIISCHPLQGTRGKWGDSRWREGTEVSVPGPCRTRTGLQGPRGLKMLVCPGVTQAHTPPEAQICW